MQPWTEAILKYLISGTVNAGRLPSLFIHGITFVLIPYTPKESQTLML